MTTTSYAVTAPPPRTEPAARRVVPLLGVSLGYFMVLLDMTVLSVAEPDLARSIGASAAGLQWTVSAYTVVFGALLLSAGAVADRYGAHRVFRTGIAVFGLGSLLCAWAPNLAVLIALRALLGVAAAACVPSSMAIITTLYPVPAERAKAVSVWAAVSGAALAAGPIVGGVLVDAFSWRAIFVINAPIAVVTLAMTADRAVRCGRGDRAIDWPPQLAACAALGLGTDAFIALGDAAYLHAGLSAAGTALIAAGFAYLERRSAAPVLHPAVLRARGMAGALLAGGAVNFAMSGVLFILPLLFQQSLGLTPLQAGLLFLPMTLPFAFNPLVAGRIVAASGPRMPVTAGLTLLTAGGLAFAGAAYQDEPPYAVLVVGLLCTGFGVSFALPALVTTVITAAPEGTAGVAGGLLNATRQLGATLGVVATGAFASTTGDGDPHAFAYALLIPAAVCLAAALPAARK